MPSIILFILSYILYILLVPRTIVEIAYRVINGGWREYLYNVARSVDQTGNATYPILLTLLFVKRRTDYIEFGDCDETISSVLGKNKRNKSLSRFGDAFGNLLERLDKNHLENAIEQL